MQNRLYLLLFLLILGSSCKRAVTSLDVTSPNGDITASIFTNQDEKLAYTVSYKGETLVDTSFLGFTFQGMNSLERDLVITGHSRQTLDNTWTQVWGEQKEIRNHCQEITVNMQEAYEPRRKFNVIFRVFNDGVGFRYEFPEQPNMASALITDELTQFKMTGNHLAWWIPADYDSYEHLYTESSISNIDATPYRQSAGDLASSRIPDVHATNTPMTMRTESGVHISIHEANLTNYAGMTLKVASDKRTLDAALVPAPDGTKVKVNLPFNTPWRTIQIGENAGDLVESSLILNLNEPNKLDDTSWIKPMKYMGIWWEMHLDKSTWHQGPKHGATTANAKRFIDFASKHQIQGLLVEGWNTGWEKWRNEDRDGIFDFVTPYDDFDIEKVIAYGKEKGVSLIGHHETSAAVSTYEERIDDAFDFYEKVGVNAVKTGYVGTITPKGEFHHGQWMVNHYRRVVEKAAAHKIMLDVHEPIKPTGIRRTYPHMMTREGVRGTEFNAWGGGNPPSHIVTLPFTRMLAGPIDYTPGIFNIKFNEYKTDQEVKTTLANQLAQYILIYSPLQMAADLVEHYENQPAFQFIEEVAVDWETSRVLNGEIGKYITMVRQARDSKQWFLGAATNEEARTLSVKLDFLEAGKKYKATIYADGPDASWNDNPTSIAITTQEVTADSSLELVLASGGGQAISFEEL